MQLRASCVIGVACALAASGCGQAPQVASVRPVQTQVIRYAAAGEPVSLSGQVQAQNQTNLAFRIGGRLIERRVSVGQSSNPAT